MAKISFNGIKFKVVAGSVVLVVVPLLCLASISFISGKKQILTDIEKTLRSESLMMKQEVIAVYDLALRKVYSDLNVARYILGRHGTISLDQNELLDFTIVNQITKEAEKTRIPSMKINDEKLSFNYTVVDTVQDTVGGTATIFQVIPEGLLRISTNVLKKDGSRAVGTYIPTSSPVYKTVMNGKTFYGRAFVVNAWYLTAYEPIKDDHNRVIGVLYVGVAEKEFQEVLKDNLAKLVIGKTGYAFILNDKGDYVLSFKRKRDGENIRDVKDADGNYFIQEMIEKGVALKKGETAASYYPWKNGEEEARMKIAAYTYFPQWKWVIGASAYQSDFLETLEKVRSILIVVCLLSIALASVVAYLFARQITNPIYAIVDRLGASSDQIASSSEQLSSSSQMLARGSSEQAAALQESSSSLEEISAMISSNASNAGEAKQMMDSVSEIIEKVNRHMNDMSGAMDTISGSSEETGKIIKTIDEIAFQTNLLALNAAVEAARAGEAGKGFAVVAEEVRNLAQRSAEAAKNTSELIKNTIDSVQNGKDITEMTRESFKENMEISTKVADLVQEIASSSEEQARGITQVNSGVSQMDKVTQQNAAGAEQSASAAENLSSQADEMKEVVKELVGVVSGSSNGTEARRADNSLGASPMKNRVQGPAGPDRMLTGR